MLPFLFCHSLYQKRNKRLNWKKVKTDKLEQGVRDRSEITGGKGGRTTIFVGRVIIFSNKILGGSLFFLPKLRKGDNFFIASQLILISVLATILQLTGPSASVNSNRSLVQSIPNTVYIIFEIICVSSHSIYLQQPRKSHIFNSIWCAVN